MGGWVCGTEATDGRFSDPAAACYPFALRAASALEAGILVLRQQLVVPRRAFPKQVRLCNLDPLLFEWSYRLCPSLLDSIVIVQSETVIRWH